MNTPVLPPPDDVGARPVPPPQPAAPPPGPATAFPTTVTSAGHLATDLGCAAGTSASALDAFFRERMGPVIGHDYQHVYDLGGDRRLWLFQDTFVDHTGNATRLDQASFAHNTAMVQTGRCFTLLHRGTAGAPLSFEPGSGDQVLSRWFWPLGGEISDGRLRVFWAEMTKTADPAPPDGLGWVPVRTWLATYDAATLGAHVVPARAGIRRAPDLRVRRGERRRAHVPVRQLVRPEPGSPGRLPLVPVLGHRDVPRPRAARRARRRARVPDRGRVESGSRCGGADRRALPRREPDAATVPRRPLGRGHEGRRLLG